jgi:SPP1 gp7 family putative phage head morphogenesis protein
VSTRARALIATLGHSGRLAHRRGAPLPRPIHPDHIRRDYAAALLRVLAPARAIISEELGKSGLVIAPTRELRADVAQAAAIDGINALRMDAGADDAQRSARRVRRRLESSVSTAQVEKLAHHYGHAVDSHQRAQLGRQLHAALGVDISHSLGGDTSRAMAAFAAQNAALITSIPRHLADDVERLTLHAVQTGRRASDLAADLEDRLGLADTRAMLIARDQIGKLHADIDQARQQAMGVTRFIWRTMNDERVRPEHADLEGETFSYDDPPDLEDGPALPGDPPLCRCYAEPVLDDLVDNDGGDEGDDTEEPDTGVAPEEEVSLPPPPADPFTADERSDYQDRALEQLDRGREDWNDYVRALDAGEVEADDVVRDGFTFSDRDVEGMRQDYAATLTPAELDASLFYSNMGDNVLNGAARYDLWASDPRAAKMARGLDSAIAKFAMPEDAYVARGMRGDWARQFVESIKPGDVFRDPGYVSTAATKPFKGEVQMRVLIPKGTHAAPIPSAYTDAESEFLLPRGTRFRVLSVRDVGTAGAPRWDVDVEVLP